MHKVLSHPLEEFSIRSLAADAALRFAFVSCRNCTCCSSAMRVFRPSLDHHPGASARISSLNKRTSKQATRLLDAIRHPMR
jgi:hypothetical protein